MLWLNIEWLRATSRRRSHTVRQHTTDPSCDGNGAAAAGAAAAFVGDLAAAVVGVAAFAVAGAAAFVGATALAAVGGAAAGADAFAVLLPLADFRLVSGFEGWLAASEAPALLPVSAASVSSGRFELTG